MPHGGHVAPDSIGRNSLADAVEETHQGRLAHALPSKDPDLALIVGLWDRLADEFKQRLIGRAETGTQLESITSCVPVSTSTIA